MIKHATNLIQLRYALLTRPKTNLEIYFLDIPKYGCTEVFG